MRAASREVLINRMSIPAINANIVEENKQIDIFLARVAEPGNLRNTDNSDGI